MQERKWKEGNSRRILGGEKASRRGEDERGVVGEKQRRGEGVSRRSKDEEKESGGANEKKN